MLLLMVFLIFLAVGIMIIRFMTTFFDVDDFIKSTSFMESDISFVMFYNFPL